MLGAIGAALASVAGPVANYFGQQETNRANRDIANAQMGFQERMRSTSHQAEVEDLKKAGLNPILSAGGSGAGTPAGASTILQAPKIELPDLMAYGVSLKQLEQKDKEIQNQTALTTAQIANTVSDSKLKEAQRILAQKGLIRANFEGKISGLMNKIYDAVEKSVRQQPQPGKMYPENLTPPLS